MEPSPKTEDKNAMSAQQNLIEASRALVAAISIFEAAHKASLEINGLSQLDDDDIKAKVDVFWSLADFTDTRMRLVKGLLKVDPQAGKKLHEIVAAAEHHMIMNTHGQGADLLDPSKNNAPCEHKMSTVYTEGKNRFVHWNFKYKSLVARTASNIEENKRRIRLQMWKLMRGWLILDVKSTSEQLARKFKIDGTLALLFFDKVLERHGVQESYNFRSFFCSKCSKLHRMEHFQKCSDRFVADKTLPTEEDWNIILDRKGRNKDGTESPCP